MNNNIMFNNSNPSHFELSSDFKQSVRTNVVNRMFPQLVSNDANLIFGYLIELVRLIIVKYNLNSNLNYETYLTNNNFQDLISLLFLLFPYIDTEEGTSKSIKSLNEIYTSLSEFNKVPQGTNINEFDKYEPKFKFSNTQYARINKSSPRNLINFKYEYLEHNFILLKETIISTANKLYVNWDTIYPIPYLTSYFTKLPLYVATNNAIINHNLEDYTEYVVSNQINDSKLDRIFNYNGLQINDVYSAIRYNLYEQVYGIKWLLYDVVISGDSNTQMIVNILDDKLYLEDIKNSKSILQIANESRNKFIQSWDKFTNDIRVKEDPISITIMKYFTKFFNTANFYNQEYKKQGYVGIDKDKYNEYRKSPIITNEEFRFYLNTFLSIKSDWAYAFLLETFNDMKKTWYWKKISNNKKNSYAKIVLPNSNKRSVVTYKNIYNFAKSLTSFIVKQKKSANDSEDKYVQFPKLWKAITGEDKKLILKRLNWNKKTQGSVTSWFNITGNLKLTAPPTINTTELNEEIHDNIINNLASIIFEIMTLNGLLSEFKFELSSPDLQVIQKNIANNREITNNSYYYLTNGLYTDLHVEYKNEKKQYEKMEYLKYMTSKIAGERSGYWNTIYALNWVSQISFYHRYLNNRVFYVTGGPGVGKSTQVPKLLLYSLKMLDYNYSGKIMCTQPRIPPTRGSGDTISSQLGVPVFRYDPAFDEYIDSNNYYVQFQYAKPSEIHVKKTNDLTLKIVTDGILLEVMKNNPILKKQIVSNQTTYDTTAVNELDIIMVDEAHEHNSNMDLILTLMKTALYYNNNIKLVIVSATMDNDEPRYRRYYRDINDNRMYPMNMMISENSIDRINVDRRIHIFPPSSEKGATTFPITQKWNTPKDRLESLILELAPQGDVLVFQPGKKEITRLVKSLNKKLPPNAIAIPYHREMSQTKKEIVEKMTPDTKKTLRYPKTVPYDEELTESDTLVPYGTYDRIVVIATNLAEASITIGTLKYVIETGTQKILIYDQEDRTEKIKLVNISESSRVQRKGRVGRKSPGTVYYMYAEGAMKENKINFDIATKNIYPILYDLLKDSNDTKPLFDAEYDINNSSKFTNIEKIINNPDRMKRIYPGNLDNIIIKQYSYQTQKNLRFLDYQGNNTHYDYENNQLPVTVYKTGFDYDTVSDYKGTFYIIHPDELILLRNILGEIVGSVNNDVIVDSDAKKIIKSKKIEYAWNNLVEANAIYINRLGNNNVIEKTKFGVLFSFLTKNLEYTLEEVNTIINAMIYDTLSDVIKVIPMLRTINYQLNNLATTPNKLPYLLNKYSNNQGDLVGILKICNDILEYSNINKILREFNPYETIDSNKVLNEEKILEYKRMILQDKALEFVNLSKSDKVIAYSLLKLASQGNLLNDVDKLSEEETSIINEDIGRIIYEIYENDKNLNNLVSNVTGVDQKIINYYISNYLSLYNKSKNYLSNNVSNDTKKKIKQELVDNIETIKNKINKIKQINTKEENNNNLIKTFISGQAYKLFKRVCTNYYINCFSLKPKTYTIPIVKINRIRHQVTFLKSNFTEYLFAVNIQAAGSTIAIINNTTIHTVQNVTPFTFLPIFVNKKYLAAFKNKQLKYDDDIDDDMDNDMDDDIKCSYDYINEITKIKRDLFKEFNTKPYYLLMDINSEDQRFVETLVGYITLQKNYADTNYNK